MSTVTFQELQQQSAAILDRVEAGEQFIVVRDGRAIAEIRPTHPPTLSPRSLGRCAGLFRVPDDINDPLPEDLLRSWS